MSSERTNGTVPREAIVLAAGFGKRLRPITDSVPKPLVRVGGVTMLDRGLDMLSQAGVEHCVVNVHYLGEQIIDYVKGRTDPAVSISDERDAILDSGGGVLRALTLMNGTAPFFLLNADTFWIDDAKPSLRSMAERWAELGGKAKMLLMLAPLDRATGHSGGRDFTLAEDGRIARYPKDRPTDETGYIYAGAAIMDPAIFEGFTDEPHSLNLHFDRMIEQGALYGHLLDGHWITVGTPDALPPAEEKIAELSTPLKRHAAAGV